MRNVVTILETEGFPIIQKAFLSNGREEDAIASSDITKACFVYLTKQSDEKFNIYKQSL